MFKIWLFLKNVTMKRVLITGGTGFIGKHLAKRLCGRKNTRLVCLVRKESREEDIAFLEQLGVGLKYCDLRDAASLKGLCRDIDTVFHLAAKIQGRKHEESAFYDLNVNGTENLVKECKKFKVRKFIHISTVGVYGPVENATEETELNPGTAYERTKTEAEDVVLNSGLDYVIVRCGSIFGPHDKQFRLAFLLANTGIVPLIGNANAMMQPLFIKDLVSILEQLMDSNIKNEILIAAGNKQVTLKEFIRMMTGKRGVLFIPFPRALCSPLCRGGDVLERALHRGLPWDSKKYSTFTESRTFDISKLKQMIHPRFTDLQIAVDETREWILHSGENPP